jgi:hypothetical protein
MAALYAKGYKKIRLKNSWGNKDSYKGVNAVFETPNGYEFELQFHTKASLAAKEKAHKLYEEQRKFLEGSPEFEHYREQQKEIFRDVPAPNNIGQIKEFP